MQLGGRNHIVERIVQRLQIGIELLLHVARQETQLLARFDGRTRQDDPLDVFFFQSPHRQGDGRIGLARTCGADGQQQVVAVVGLHQLELIDRAGPDDRAVVAIDDHVLIDGSVVFDHPGRKSLLYRLFGDIAVFEVVSDQPVQSFPKPFGIASGAEHRERRSASDDFEVGMQLLHLFEVNILGAVQLPGIHPLDVDLLIFGIHHKLKTNPTLNARE